MKLEDWKIDNSAGRPILTYKDCSVIEAEDAEFVLAAIKAALSTDAEPVAWQWRSKLGPHGWDSAAFSVQDPGTMSAQYEKRALYSAKQEPEP